MIVLSWFCAKLNGTISMLKRQSDIARIFRVSQMTISKVLNNKPGVSPKLKKKILNYIKRSGFSTNRIASTLASGKSKMIGLLVPSISHSFFSQITDRIEELCHERGYYPVLYHTKEDYEHTVHGIRLLVSLRVAGFIIAPLANSRETAIYKELYRKKVPFVFIDRYLPGSNSSYVVTDAGKGEYEAVKYLIELGHKNIVFVRGPDKASSARSVYLGYRKAICEYGLKEKTFTGGFEEEDGYRAAKRIVDSGINPTAIVAVNDPVAIGVMQYLDEAGVKVPDDVSLVGFSDIKTASKLRAPLTTVRENVTGMAEKSIDILFRMIEEKKKIVEKVKLESRLIIRGSTKPI